MGKIRIGLAVMQPILRDIVRDALARQPDMEIVADLDEGDELLRAVHGIDVAIVAAPEPDDCELARRVLQTSPGAKVLAIAGSGRNAILWSLRPYRVTLGDVSTELLISAIRADFEASVKR